MIRLAPRQQRGMTLVVAMILLAALSLLAITSLRSTVMQERMSANAYDHDLAFQAAEAGLRLGEYRAEQWAKNGITSTPDSTCPKPNADGLYISTQESLDCVMFLESQISYWHDASADEGVGASFVDQGTSLSPFYIVELISNKAPCNPNAPGVDLTCKRFRVTASSRDTDGRARVILQSIYATE